MIVTAYKYDRNLLYVGASRARHHLIILQTNH
ncbi:ATP-binding domain-containing protein [Scytonema hofmannii]